MSGIENYENLANAIVLQAVRDYRTALKLLKMNPSNKSAKIEKENIERFFWSDWYKVLTSVDGESLIRVLRKEVDA
ncbi:hypothetical protein [Selenomonas bovis]|uniref:hypothetical protein n=1 Tax=Selenomonas bovis TaxID=416586 RepID=UPI000367E7B6|nr:hypothetical protein [Selenomonas bovis]